MRPEWSDIKSGVEGQGGLGGQAQQCASCGQSFTCGRYAPAGCWCARLEPVSAEALRSLAVLGERCLCPSCLAQIAG
ncbi:MAG: hypothetical protein E6F96_12940 [Actinobacteria bacterium]|nr:MAG: hypothetical protein E6F96_12940 [Actinomycetota bacterium]